jgi:glucokinase
MPIPDSAAAWRSKAAFRRQLGEVPVALINRNDLELLGAAAALGNA